MQNDKNFDEQQCICNLASDIIDEGNNTFKDVL